MDATTAGLVGVAIGGVLVGLLTLPYTLLSRRNLRHMFSNEREERRLAELRAWRDRSTPALVQTRNLLTTYHAAYPQTIAGDMRHLDVKGRAGYVERVAKEIEERANAVGELLTEISCGHPSQAVRDLAEEVRTFVLRHCNGMRDQFLNGEGTAQDFRPDSDHARQVVTELTNALHSTLGGKPDPLSVILDS